MVRRMGTQSDMQSATFKSIRSVQPLLDRVLVQRFKAETVSARMCSLSHSLYIITGFARMMVEGLVGRWLILRKPRPASSSLPPPPPRHCQKQPSSPSAQAQPTKKALSCPSLSSLATASCCRDGAVTRSRSAKR